MKKFLLPLLVLTFSATAAAAACNPTGTVPQGVVVYHGAPVSMFTWLRPDLNPGPPFDHPSNPDGPAWFAGNWQFSIHAGMRFLVGQSDKTMYLYQYQLKQTLAVLVCDNHHDFTAQTGISFAHGDYDAAVEFCREQAPMQYNGYVIRQDRVRGEPELILCDPSAVLTYKGQEEWLVTQVAGNRTGGIGDNFGGQRYACFLDNGVLTDFECRAATAARQLLAEAADSAESQ